MAEVTAVVSQQATRVVSRGRRREAAAVTVGAQMRSAVNGRSVAAIQAVRCCETGRGRRAQHAAQRAGTPGAPVTRSSAGSLFNGKPGAAEDANVLELQVQLCTDILVFWIFFLIIWYVGTCSSGRETNRFSCGTHKITTSKSPTRPQC